MKKRCTPRQVQLERRERQIAQLALYNSEYAYADDKRNPDPVLPYRIWIKKIINENGI